MGRKKLQRSYDQKLIGSYGGVAALRRVVPDQDVGRWLSEQDTYTLHKPVRRRFKRCCVVVGGSNQQWQADLDDVTRLKKTNDGTAFLLTVIDVFSKRAWCIPLKNKSAVSLVAAFTPLLDDKVPITLQTDKASEFLNSITEITQRVEEVLRWRNKRREAYVKWFGWPAAFNSWIDAKTLVNYSI